MKRVRVNVGKIAIVFKNGDFRRVITAGTHWLGFSESIVVYDMAAVYGSDKRLNIMLHDEKFQSLVEVVNVSDNEIALIYIDGNFDTLLTSGKYFYWKGLVQFDVIIADISKVEITEDINLSVLQKTAVNVYVRSFTVESFEEGLLFVDGKFSRLLKMGTYYFWRNAISVNVAKVDLRQQQLEVSGQEILTKDKASLRVNFFGQYKVVNVEKALLNSKDYEKQLYVLVQLALREFIGTLSLDELLENKNAVAEFVMGQLKEKSLRLGVEILDAGIKDLILPGDVKEIMNQVLVAQKQSEANTIYRREETASTRSLLNTAKLLEENSMLFKLKEMEYMEKIAGKIGEITIGNNGEVLKQLNTIFSGK